MGIIILGIISGITVGLLSGLVGIGGGVVLVPLLLYVFKVDMHVAAGTSLAIIIPTAISGVVGHLSHGNVSWKLALIITIGAIAGSFLGAWMANILPAASLKKIFAFLLLLISIKVLLDAYNIQLFGGSQSTEQAQAAVTESSQVDSSR